jgi:hypothetical protein
MRDVHAVGAGCGGALMSVALRKRLEEHAGIIYSVGRGTTRRSQLTGQMQSWYHDLVDRLTPWTA